MSRQQQEPMELDSEAEVAAAVCGPTSASSFDIGSDLLRLIELVQRGMTRPSAARLATVLLERLTGSGRPDLPDYRVLAADERLMEQADHEFDLRRVLIPALREFERFAAAAATHADFADQALKLRETVAVTIRDGNRPHQRQRPPSRTANRTTLYLAIRQLQDLRAEELPFEIATRELLALMGEPSREFGGTTSEETVDLICAVALLGRELRRGGACTEASVAQALAAVVASLPPDDDCRREDSLTRGNTARQWLAARQQGPTTAAAEIVPLGIPIRVMDLMMLKVRIWRIHRLLLLLLAADPVILSREDTDDDDDAADSPEMRRTYLDPKEAADYLAAVVAALREEIEFRYLADDVPAGWFAAVNETLGRLTAAAERSSPIGGIDAAERRDYANRLLGHLTQPDVAIDRARLAALTRRLGTALTRYAHAYRMGYDIRHRWRTTSDALGQLAMVLDCRRGGGVVGAGDVPDAWWAKMESVCRSAQAAPILTRSAIDELLVKRLLDYADELVGPHRPVSYKVAEQRGERYYLRNEEKFRKLWAAHRLGVCRPELLCRFIGDICGSWSEATKETLRGRRCFCRLVQLQEAYELSDHRRVRELYPMIARFWDDDDDDGPRPGKLTRPELATALHDLGEVLKADDSEHHRRVYDWTRQRLDQMERVSELDPDIDARGFESFISELNALFGSAARWADSERIREHFASMCRHLDVHDNVNVVG